MQKSKNVLCTYFKSTGLFFFSQKRYTNLILHWGGCLPSLVPFSRKTTTWKNFLTLQAGSCDKFIPWHPSQCNHKTSPISVYFRPLNSANCDFESRQVGILSIDYIYNIYFLYLLHYNIDIIISYDFHVYFIQFTNL